MPIVFDSEKQAFVLREATEEEIQAIERIAIDYIAQQMGNQIAQAYISNIIKREVQNDFQDPDDGSKETKH